MDLYVRLTEAFMATPGSVLSIHQISKQLEIPYGTAYNRVHQLGEMGVIRIVPHGKAKLCTLNPTCPTTANLLALGASQRCAAFLNRPALTTSLVGRLRELLETRSADHLHCAVLLNAQAISQSAENEEAEPPSSLDLFLLLPSETHEDRDLEAALYTSISSTIHLPLTRMVVTPSTLLGMLREKENEAGSAAFQMLQRGLILTGFERFFRLVLRAYAPPVL